MGSGHLNGRKFDGLKTFDGLNGWDVRGGELVLVVAGKDEETGLPFTQETAFELLDEVDLAELEAWAIEQGQELPGLFERLPATSFRRAA